MFEIKLSFETQFLIPKIIFISNLILISKLNFFRFEKKNSQKSRIKGFSLKDGQLNSISKRSKKLEFLKIDFNPYK